MKSYALIVNPSSGKGRALTRAEELRRELTDATVELLETRGRGDATVLTAEVAHRVDRVIAVGGDGTLHEVLNGLLESGLSIVDRPDLGFLPTGTANVATKAFGLHADPVSVAAALADTDATPVDVGVVVHEGGRRAFLLWFGAGWDGVVIHALNSTRSGQMGVSGLVGHLPGVLDAITRYDQPKIATIVDGDSVDGLGSVIVANVGQIAFGGTVAEHADPADGLFDVVGVPLATFPGSIALAFRMMVSSLSRSSRVRCIRGCEVTLEADGEVPFQMDGEPVGVLPATVTLVSGAVRILRT